MYSIMYSCCSFGEGFWAQRHVNDGRKRSQEAAGRTQEQMGCAPACGDDQLQMGTPRLARRAGGVRGRGPCGVQCDTRMLKHVCFRRKRGGWCEGVEVIYGCGDEREDTDENLRTLNHVTMVVVETGRPWMWWLTY